MSATPAAMQQPDGMGPLRSEALTGSFVMPKLSPRGVSWHPSIDIQAANAVSPPGGDCGSGRPWQAWLVELFEEQQQRICGTFGTLLASQEAKLDRLLAVSLDTSRAGMRSVAITPTSGTDSAATAKRVSELHRMLTKSQSGTLATWREMSERDGAQDIQFSSQDSKRRPVERSNTNHIARGTSHHSVRSTVTPPPPKPEGGLVVTSPITTDKLPSPAPGSSPATVPTAQTTNGAAALFRSSKSKSGASMGATATHTSISSWRNKAKAHIRRDDMQQPTGAESRIPFRYPIGSRARRAIERMEEVEELRRSMSVKPHDGEAENEDGSAKRVERVRLRQKLRSCTHDIRFEVLVFIMILANVIMVGVEVEHSSQSDIEWNNVFLILDACFTSFFVFELVLRCMGEGIDFFGAHQRWWNAFDCFVVGASVIELISSGLASSSSLNIEYLRFIRIVRIARVLRSVRLIRLIRFIRALRTLVDSIFATLKSLTWAILLIMMILYGFGLVITQTVTRHIHDNDNVDVALLEFWESLPEAMFTLFKSITGGVSWHDAVQPLTAVSPVMVGLFVLYITFTLFAVLNVLTAVFCQSAIDSAAQDKETIAIYQMANQRKNVDIMKQLFTEIDEDNSGTISLREFESYLGNEEVRAFFDSLGIDTDDAANLFKLLDKDGNGSLELQTFLDGCLSLKGSARAIQIAQLQHENQWQLKLLECFMQDLFEQLDGIHQRLQLGFSPRATSEPSTKQPIKRRQSPDMELGHEKLAPHKPFTDGSAPGVAMLPPPQMIKLAIVEGETDESDEGEAFIV